MTPKFTTPCYVRVDDKDKRNEVYKELTNFGLKQNPLTKKIGYSTIITKDDYYFDVADGCILPDQIAIDCGTNTELFLALAGMRSDTDKGQWFVVDEPISIGTQMLSIGAMFNLAEDKFNNSIKAHRSTATEIINHHKQKGQ